MIKGWMLRMTTAVVPGIALGLSACSDDVTGPADGQVALVLQGSGGSVDGSNGSLVLESMHVVMEEFGLEGDIERPDGIGGEVKIELGPRFLEVPLAEVSTTAFTGSVPAARYDKVELEIEDLKDDDPLLEDIRAGFAEWPDDASIVLTGTFTPEDGSASEFLVFIEAEIEVEWDLEPSLEIAGPGSGAITVRVDPRPWFEGEDGTVVDLSTFHCDPAAECPVVDLDDELEGDGGDAFTLIDWQ